MTVAPARLMSWPPERTLVGVDFSEGARAALDVAADIAWRTHSRIDLVHTIDYASARLTGYDVIDQVLLAGRDPATLREHAQSELETLARGCETTPVELHLVYGEPSAELQALRARLDADLLVVGARGLHGLRRFLLGSVADRLMRRPGCPLLLVDGAPAAGEFKQLLVGLEIPDDATPALRTALAVAHDLRAELSVLHVLPPRGYASDRRHVELQPQTAPSRIEKLLAELDPTVPASILVRRGDPAHIIPQVARELESQLVVLGAERNPDGWPGRVVDRVARAGLPALLLVWPESAEKA